MTAPNSNIGAQVNCEDKPCGTLLRVALDPYTQRVTDLIVERGLLSQTSLVVPVSAVKRATEKEIHLSVSSDKLDGFMEFREKDYTVPASGWVEEGKYKAEQVVLPVGPAGMVYPRSYSRPVVPLPRCRVSKDSSPDLGVVGRGTQVNDLEGPLGKVDHVLVDEETGEACYLVVDKGFYSQTVVVPTSLVKRVDEDTVLVEASGTELEQLPQCACRPDADILAEVKDRLDKASFDTSEVQVELEDGVVRLSGVVWDVTSKRCAEAICRDVEGVVEIDNALDTNTAMTVRVTTALLTDPRTEVSIIAVNSDRRFVTLEGQVDSTEIRKAAEEIASNQTGVIQVINKLKIGKDDYTRALNFRMVASLAAAQLSGVGDAGSTFWT